MYKQLLLLCLESMMDGEAFFILKNIILWWSDDYKKLSDDYKKLNIAVKHNFVQQLLLWLKKTFWNN